MASRLNLLNISVFMIVGILTCSIAMTDASAAPHSSDDISLSNTMERTTSVLYSYDWEGDWQGWFVDDEVWDVGIPTSGPGIAHGGEWCAATNLDGNYGNNSDSRLISPYMDLPADPDADQIWLRFWHASDMEGGDSGDYGVVQVSCDGEPWEDLPNSTVTWNGGNVWGQALHDLSAYAGCSVRVAFRFYSNSYATGSGWYIDDVSIEEGNIPPNNPEDFDGTPPWHHWQDKHTWSITGGIWEIGAPGAGPGAAHSSPNCAGTILSGNYPIYSTARLNSPEYPLPPTPLGEELWLLFRQSCSFEGGDGGDYGRVEISCDGGPWETLSGSTVRYHGANTWGLAAYDLSAYAGCTVQVSYFMTSNSYAGGPGWYLDDVGIQEGRPTFRGSPEGFETGTGGWSTRNGVWQIGEPTSGPSAAFEGVSCQQRPDTMKL